MTLTSRHTGFGDIFSNSCFAKFVLRGFFSTRILPTMLQEEGGGCTSPTFLQGGSISVIKYDQDTAFKVVFFYRKRGVHTE